MIFLPDEGRMEAKPKAVPKGVAGAVLGCLRVSMLRWPDGIFEYLFHTKIPIVLRPCHRRNKIAKNITHGVILRSSSTL